MLSYRNVARLGLAAFVTVALLSGSLAWAKKPPKDPPTDPPTSPPFVYQITWLTSSLCTPRFAIDINNNGNIVRIASRDGGERAFLYTAGIGVQDLNDLAGPESGWNPYSAYGINDSGQVVGLGTPNGESHSFGFRFTPGDIDGQEPVIERMALPDAVYSVAAWTQSDGTDVNVWTTRFDQEHSTWGTAEKIEDAPLDALRPTVDMNATGAAHVLWTQSDGNLNHIHAAIVQVPGNFPPSAINDSAATSEDTPVTLTNASLLSNDSDPDGDPLSITGFGTPGNGTLADNGDGTVTYTPNPDFNGTDTFTYTISDGNGGTDTGTVTVNVLAQPDDPVAVDDAFSTTEGTPVTDNVLANDTDADGDTLTAALTTDPTGGAVTLSANGSFTYTPNTGTTTDTFTYTVSDGNGGTDTATVMIDVSAAPSETALYVYDIDFASKAGGKFWQAVFVIYSDDGDVPAAGVAITVEFAEQTYTGTTDADGIFRTDLVKDLGSGNHYAEVVDLVLTDHYWDPLLGLDLEDDTDGDALPDAVLPL